MEIVGLSQESSIDPNSMMGLGNAEISMDDMSLGSMADFDTSGLTALTSRLPVKGTHIVKLGELRLSKQESNDPAKKPLWNVNIKYEILEARPTDATVDPEPLVGRVINERYTIWPDDVKECIQLLMGRFMAAGLNYHGRLGGMEGMEPGWLDEGVDKLIRLRVRHYSSKDGVERAGFDWLKYDPESGQN